MGEGRPDRRHQGGVTPTRDGAECFSNGPNSRERVTRDADAVRAFAPNSRSRWQCDLAMLAKQRLHKAGLTQIFGGHWCTYEDGARFFSFRRDGLCGRMAALIWRS